MIFIKKNRKYAIKFIFQQLKFAKLPHFRGKLVELEIRKFSRSIIKSNVHREENNLHLSLRKLILLEKNMKTRILFI